jgi:lipase chaperone LimK
MHRESEHTENKLREIIMKLSDVLTQNVSIKNQLSKVDKEIVARLNDLQAAVDKLTADLADAPLTEEQAASFADVQTAVQSLDDITPDEVTPAV